MKLYMTNPRNKPMAQIAIRVTTVGVVVLLLASSCLSSPVPQMPSRALVVGVGDSSSGDCDGGHLAEGVVEAGGGFDFWFFGEVVLPLGVEGVVPRVRSVGIHTVSNSVEWHRNLLSGDFNLQLRDSSGGVVKSVEFPLDPPGVYSGG